MIFPQDFMLPIIIVGVVLFLLLFFHFIPIRLWVAALASGVKISIFTLIGMRIRNVVPANIVLHFDQGEQGRS